MAIQNFTKNSSLPVLFPLLKKLFFSSHHEKKSCSLGKFTQSEMLELNGKYVDISYTSFLHSFCITKRGRVLAVLLPFSEKQVSPAILFLADGASDPDYCESDTVISPVAKLDNKTAHN